MSHTDFDMDDFVLLNWGIVNANDGTLQETLEIMGIYRWPYMKEGETSESVTEYLLYGGNPSTIRMRLDLFT